MLATAHFPKKLCRNRPYDGSEIGVAEMRLAAVYSVAKRTLGGMLVSFGVTGLYRCAQYALGRSYTRDLPRGQANYGAVTGALGSNWGRPR